MFDQCAFSLEKHAFFQTHVGNLPLLMTGLNHLHFVCYNVWSVGVSLFGCPHFTWLAFRTGEHRCSFWCSFAFGSFPFSSWELACHRVYLTFLKSSLIFCNSWKVVSSSLLLVLQSCPG